MSSTQVVHDATKVSRVQI